MPSAMKANTLKTRIKAEMARRNGYGSLEEYSAATYDFEKNPVSGEGICLEQGKKLIEPMIAIADVGTCHFTKVGETMEEFEENFALLSAKMDKLEKENYETGTSSCRSACSGLCHGSCVNGCNGCGSQCEGQCYGCTASCGTSCTSGLMR